MKTSPLFFLAALQIFSTLGLAASSPPVLTALQYRFGHKVEVLKEDTLTQIMVSASCLTTSGRRNCLAWKRLSYASLSMIKSSEPGGKEPGSLICQGLKGKPITGIRFDGAENGFCRFSDGSIISNGSLELVAAQNDKANSQTPHP